MQKQRGFTLVELMITIVCLISIPAVIGWGMNLYKLFHMQIEPVTTMLVVRIIGILPPVGAIVGWF